MAGAPGGEDAAAGRYRGLGGAGLCRGGVLFCCWRGCGQAESAVFLGLRQCGGLSVRRFGVVVGLVGVVGVVSGCSSGADVGAAGQTGAAGPASSEAAVSPEPAAFHFDSGDLVIGPFDPEEVKHNLFDPCTEISDAEFAAAGMVKSPIPEEVSPLVEGISFCAIETEDLYESGAIGVTPLTKAEILRVTEELPDYSAKIVPSSFAFPPRGGDSSSCFVAVETKRGTLAALASSLRNDDGYERVCPSALKMLTGLYTATNDLKDSSLLTWNSQYSVQRSRDFSWNQ